VAKAIHFNSSRAKKPFVAVNLSSIPESLIESELFGHVKGSFTGAITDRIGKFEEAEGGKIFLDEIGEISLNIQVKISRAIQERIVTKLGTNKSSTIDCLKNFNNKAEICRFKIHGYAGKNILFNKKRGA
jgi:transcriptional regulator with GAF, ATPase, and Fis domain